MTQLRISMPALIGAKHARQVGLALLAIVALWVVAYACGLWPWLGYASQSRASINVGRFPIGEMSTGRFRLGFGTFVFFRGQRIVLDYDAQIADGCMSMHVWRIGTADGSADFNDCVDKSGQGEWTVPVTATGIYHVFVTPRSVKGRWDMSYSIWWGARG